MFFVGAQAQSTTQLVYQGSWNGMVGFGLQWPEVNPTTPYSGFIFSSSPTSCYYTVGTSPPPLWGAANIATFTGTLPSGVTGRPGCDLRGPGMRPATKSHPLNPNPVAAAYGWGYQIANVTTAGSAPRAFTVPGGSWAVLGIPYSQATPVAPYVQFNGLNQHYNDFGTFGPGLGMPNTTWSNATLGAKIKFSGGGFGGTMRLLQHSAGFYGLTTTVGGGYQEYISKNTNLYNCVGGSFNGTCKGTLTINFRTGPPPTYPVTYSVMTTGFTMHGFPWGTGTLTFTFISASPPVDFLTTMGSDARTSGGLGNIKMVTPFFTALQGMNIGWSGEQELVFNFVPEPGRGVMLAAGALLLAGLVQLRRRRR
jgi:hypothetical protein